ncbi:hypothetical protein [Deinococcus aquaticus]|uniref:hypothetical protein n=1 Tax=Deinococcus aquaticus TaxID=328692 RepID=UPI003F48FD6F
MIVDFWEFYKKHLDSMPLVDRILILQKSMAGWILDSNLVEEGLFRNNLLKVFNAQVPSYWIDDERVDIKDVRSYYDEDFISTFRKMCDAIGDEKTEAELIASICASACAGYSDDDSYSDNFENYLDLSSRLNLNLCNFIYYIGKFSI